MFIFLSLSALVSATVQQIVIQPVQACPLFRCASPQCRIAPCADGNRACDAVPTIESDGGKCCVGCDCNPLWIDRTSMQVNCTKPAVAPPTGPCEGGAVVGPCKAALSRFFFDETTRSCKPFTYGGCEGTANNYDSLDACQAKCAPAPVQCQTVPSSGSCLAAFRRFFFNVRTQQCEPYTWGGCNEAPVNSFVTLSDCQAKCGGGVVVTPKPTERPAACPLFRCLQPVCRIAACADGNRACPARPTIEREGGVCCPACSCAPLWLDKNNKTVDCATPEPATPEPFVACRSVPSSGNCDAAFTRFFFDVKTGSCQKYTWGGCNEQTGNSFATEADCFAKCSAVTPSPTRSPACPLFKCAAIDCRIAACAEGNRACPARPTIEREGGVCCPACGCAPLWLDKNNATVNCELATEATKPLTRDTEATITAPNCVGPAVPGQCRGAFPSWFFNEKTQQCEKFVWGGCGGSANRHSSEGECESRCKPATTSRVIVDDMTRDSASTAALSAAAALLVAAASLL